MRGSTEEILNTAVTCLSRISQLIVISNSPISSKAEFSIMMSAQAAFLSKRKRHRRDDSDDDDESADEDEAKCLDSFVMFQFLNSMILEGSSILGRGPSVRLGNVHRNRELIIEWSHNLDDTMFNRQFRICREDFYYVLFKIESGIRKTK